MRKPKKRKTPLNDLSRSLTPRNPNHKLIAVVELGKKGWLVAGIIPGVERQPLQKPAGDEDELSKLRERRRAERRRWGTKSSALPSPSRPAGTTSGGPAGWEHGGVKPTSFMQQAWP
jgi:transposase